MEIPTAVAGKTAEFAVEPVIRQGGYIIHYKSNLHTLQTRVDELKATRERVQNEIDAAKRRGDNIHLDVENWKKKVDETTGKAEELLNDDRAKTKCLLGFCPNLLTRHQLSRKSTKLLEVVVELNGKGVFPSISFAGPAEEVFLMSTKDYEAFESRNLTIKGIIDELSNPDTNKIGVYGIGGVGKTTLVEEVVRRVMEDKLFDDVVMVRDVKENPDIGRIQKEIAEKLDMDSNALESRSIADKARRICGRISNKNTLIVLDDIWSYVDLKAVGLPDVATCKVLLTSRIKELLSSKMGTQKNFQLANLEENECWQLFESKAGEVVKDQRIRTVAAQVANRCGGLPILVVTVARALKEGTLPEWRNALKRLKKFEKKGSAEQAFLALEWSYDRLDDEGLKPLFLLCGVIARNNFIWLEDLLKLAMGLGLLKNVDTVEEARDLLLSLVKKLKGFCLLLDTNSDTAVRMHDLVIDVADNIASRDGRFLSVACGAELKNWTDEGLFGKCSKISIKSDSLAKLSDVLKCQKLEMFHLGYEEYGETPQVPNGFFANMEKLKVLSLRSVKNLASLGFLKNLQALCLDRCKMEDIAVVGELRKLEILILVGSNIKELPKEIGELTGLRLLDLTCCFYLQVIAPNVLSRLTRLEDLRVRNSSIKWEAEQEGERSNASLSELKHLSLLTALEINISNLGMLPKDLFFDKLERFYIRIGDHDLEERSMNTLKLQFTTGDELDQGLKMLVKRSEYLTLKGGVNVNETADRLEGDNFRQLKCLQLRKLGTTYIIDSKVVFSSLTTLEVTNCDGIKFLFSSSTARSLVQLKTLTISRCRSMVEIVSTQEDEEKNNIATMFSKLESLTLIKLPSLIGFCLGSYAGFSSLEEALISNGQSKSTTITKEIEDGDSKDHLGVDNAVHYFLFDKKVVFSSLTTLEVTDCDGIKFLFSSSTARSLVQLKTLTISQCRSMVEIVSTQEDEEKNNIATMFSKLESLTLSELPSLIGFCSGSYAGFSSLEEALISNGQSKSTTIMKEIEDGDSKDHQSFDNVVHYFLFDEKVTFPRLEILWLVKLPKLEVVWQNQLALESFSRLKQVKVQNCSSLINLFVPCITKTLDALETLRVESCLSLEVVFKCGGLNFEETQDPSTKELKTFNCCPNLENLIIQGSDKLKYIFQTKERLETVPKFVFLKVTKLSLLKLPQFKSIYSGTHVSQWPSLQKLNVMECGEVEIIAGELSVYQEKQESVSHSNPIEQPLILIEKVVFSNLTTLEVTDCDGIKFLFSSSTARSLVQLKTLTISRCRSMVEIVSTQEDEEKNNIATMFSKLESLTLSELPSLIGFCSGSYAGFSSLEEALISNGQSKSTIITKEIEDGDSKDHLGVDNAVHYFLFDKKVVFSSLTTLEVTDCDGIKFLFSSSTARSLFQLKTLTISRSRSMVEIVSTQEDEEKNNIATMFSKLESLTLSELPSLIGFCSGSYAGFSSLEEALISNGQSKSTTITKEIEDGDSKDHLSVDNAVHYFLFDEKVTFPRLEILQLVELPKLEVVWQNQLAPDSFSRLKKVEVWRCSGLINLFVHFITERLDALETLDVSSCPSLEVVFKCGGLKFKETHDPSTKELKTFNYCPNVKKFSIHTSDKLKYIFQTEERLETVPEFVFPKVTELWLCNLPQFKSIYPGTHVSQWPSLQYLSVDECGEVKIIAGELSVYQEKQESASHYNPIEQPLILIEKGSSLFPSLETLTLGAMEMWSGPPPAQVCSKVKLVDVHGATFSKHAAFLQRLHNLKKISLWGGRNHHCREAFVDEGNSGAEIHPVGIFPQVMILTLHSLNGIMHIGTESSQSAVPVFPKLVGLRVRYCSRLKNLDSSTISFQNLISLTVDSLDGLKYLVSHRIARSLMQLTRLKIRCCKRMGVIVATEEDDDELAFSRLQHLEFFDVPHLRGLCSGNCILKLPSLETLFISRRLKSKLFSHDEIRCDIYYKWYDTDVEDAPADDEDGGDDNEVNDNGDGNDKKDDEDNACDA